MIFVWISWSSFKITKFSKNRRSLMACFEVMWLFDYFGVLVWYRTELNYLFLDFKRLVTAGAASAPPLGLIKGFDLGPYQRAFSTHPPPPPPVPFPPWILFLGTRLMRCLSNDPLTFFAIPLKRHHSKISG